MWRIAIAFLSFLLLVPQPAAAQLRKAVPTTLTETTPTITEYQVPTNASQPLAIAVGPDGNLWFTENASQKIGRISPTTGAISDYPVPYYPPPSDRLMGIAAGPDGNLWFTDTDHDSVAWMDTSGHVVDWEYHLPTPFQDPGSIVAGPDGAMWFTEGARIGRITMAGVITEYNLPSPGGLPSGLVVGPDGALWFTEAMISTVGRITTAGVITEYPVPTSNSFPLGIAAGPDGALWFTEEKGGRIGRITTSGVVTEYPVTTTGNDLYGITAGPASDGVLWFSDSGANKIGRITTAGAITEYALPTSGAGPRMLVTGPDGAIWFTEQTRNQIGRLVLPGGGSACTFTLSSSSASVAAGGGSGSFTLTAGLGCMAGTASSDVTWITAISSGSTVSYSVQANTSTSSRIGHITVNRQTFTVTQAGASVACSYSLSSSLASVAAGGGSGSFTVTAGTDCATGTASSDVTWITAISSGSTVNYSVQANTSTSSRIGHITVNGQTFTVAQAGASVICSYSLSSSSASVAAGGGSGSFTVTAGTGCALSSAAADVAWITPTISGSMVNYTVQANASTSSRIGHITVNGQTFTVTQAGASATPTETNITITEYQVPTSASQPLAIAAGPDGNLWFTENDSQKIGRINPTTGAISEYPVLYIPTSGRLMGIAAGPDGNLWFTDTDNNAVAWIDTSGRLAGREYPVLTLNQNPGSIVAGPDGAMWFTEDARIGRVTIDWAITEYNITTPGGLPSGLVVGPDGALWFTEAKVGKIGRITTAGEITEYPVPTSNSFPLGIAAGPDGALWFTEEKGGKIGRITTSGVVTEYPVTTTGNDLYGIAVGPASDGALWFSDSGANKIGRITIAGDITEFALPTSGAGPRMLVTGPDGAIWFTEQTRNQIGRLALAGGGTTCTYTLSSSSAFVAAGGGGGNFTVIAGCTTGTASSDVTWITAVTSVSTVNYTVQPNTGTSSRIGHITVNGQTFTVTQAGASVTCSYSLSSSSASVAAGGGSGSFTVTADTGCVVGTASSDVIWITPATSGSTVNYTVQPNTTSNSRTGHITVNGQTFTVTQAGAGPAVPPAINTGGIVNAADYTVSLAPGSMTALYGQNLAPATLGASSVPLPNTLSNVWVDITDANGQSSQAPLYFVSANQINFQMPFGVASPVDVRVRNAAGSSDTQSVPLWPRAPKLITKTQDGKGDPILLHSKDYSLVSAQSPAMPNEYLVLLLTGLGAVNPQIEAGRPGGDNAGLGPLNIVTSTVTVSIGGRTLATSFAGLMPGFPGVYQVNFQVPPAFLPGSYSFYAMVDNAMSQDGVTTTVGISAPMAATGTVDTSGGVVR